MEDYDFFRILHLILILFIFLMLETIRYIFLLGFLLTLSKYCCCVYAGCIIVAAMCCIVTLHICVWAGQHPGWAGLQSAPSVQGHQTPSPWTPTSPSTRTGSTPSARSQVVIVFHSSVQPMHNCSRICIFCSHSCMLVLRLLRILAP